MQCRVVRQYRLARWAQKRRTFHRMPKLTHFTVTQNMKQIMHIFSRLKPSGKCTCHVPKNVTTLYLYQWADSSGRAKAWVCSRSLAGIAGSNPAGECCEWCVLSDRSMRRANDLSRRVMPSVVCLSVISKPQRWGAVDPLKKVILINSDLFPYTAWRGLSLQHWRGVIHVPLYYRVNPNILSPVGDAVPGYGCGSPNHTCI